MKPWRERPFRHEFKEEFDLTLKRRRGNRVRTLRPLAVMLYTECGVLSRNELELAAARLDAELPQVGCDVHAFGDFGPVKLVVRSRHCFRNPMSVEALQCWVEACSAGR